MAEIKKIAIRTLIILISALVIIVGLAFAVNSIIEAKINQPYPIMQLKIHDGALLYQKDLLGELILNPPIGYRVSITNNGSDTAKDFSFRFDFFDENNSPIDGRELTINKEVPPNSTRKLDVMFYHNPLKTLPEEWTYSVTFLGAIKKTEHN